MKTATTNFAGFLRTYFAIGAAISALAIYQTQVQTQALLKIGTRYKWALLMFGFAANAALGLYIALRRARGERFLAAVDAWSLKGTIGKMAGAVLVVAPLPIFLYARADYFGSGMEAFFRLLWLSWWLAIVQAAGVRLATGMTWFRALASALLLDGVAAQLFTLGTAITDYPFSMGWSEASRYYYGSLVFSRTLYGEAVPLSVMHGTRYLLQSLPFALNGIPLWGARLWQVLLWVGLTLWSSWALARRLRIGEPVGWWLAIAWLFVYYFQGAVYYHLQVPVILVLLGVNAKRPWRSLAAVVLASLWAGMSRVNWFPVPAMLAVALYLLETPMRERVNLWQYFRLPLYFGAAGLAAAFAGQAIYIAISGNTNLEAFASSFTSALLWYRWLPSPTNAIGIVPGVIIVSLPIAAVIAWRLKHPIGALHPLRLIGLGGMLLVLLAGGLVVSTKIGGGGDLHNMDAYLVLLAIIGAYLLWGEVPADVRTTMPRTPVPEALLVLMVLVPVAFTLLRLGGPVRYDRALAAADLAMLRHEVQSLGTTGDVLFMYERHLVTFGMIPGIKLVPEYEVVTLMEMAISGNEAYLNQYYDDLASHRFSAIVAHPQNLGVETGDFIEENDAWNRYVGQPLLCQYKPALTLNYSNVQVLVPRARPCLEFPPKFGVE